MSYIDAHVHVWTGDLQSYPIASNFTVEDMQPPTFKPEELLAHCRPNGVDRIVLIQMSFYGFNNAYMLEVMRQHPGVFSGVAIVDATGESPQEEMARLAEEGVRGFRIYPSGVTPETWLEGDGYQKMFAAGARQNLAMCPLIDPEYLPAVGRMCERYPDTPVVIDHLARIGCRPICQEDIDALCALARHPRVMVKVSAFYALGEKRPPHFDLIPLIRSVRDAFGADRLMWASDCPYQVQDESYEDSIALVRSGLDFLSPEEKDQILRGTAEEFFFS